MGTVLSSEKSWPTLRTPFAVRESLRQLDVYARLWGTSSGLETELSVGRVHPAGCEEGTLGLYLLGAK